MSSTGNKCQKHPVLTDLEAPCILVTDYLRIQYYKDPKGYWWTVGVANGDIEEIKQLSTLSSLLENISVVGFMRVEEQQVPIATVAMYWLQYCTYQDFLVPIHELICQLESQGVVSETCLLFNKPIWWVQNLV